MNRGSLYRSRTDRIIGGVAGGFGEYFDIESIFFRILFALLAFVTGVWPMILLYIALVIAIPKRPRATFDEQKQGDQSEAMEFRQQSDGSYAKSTVTSDNLPWYEDTRLVAGGILLLVGLIALINQFTPVFIIGAKVFWAVVIILLGAYIIWQNKK